MKIIKTILLVFIKILFYWFYLIPFNLGIIAFLGYNLIMYLCFGSLNANDAKDVLEPYGVFGIYIFIIAVPYFLSFFTLFGGSDTSRNVDMQALDDLILHRNGMMQHKDDKEAFEIYKKNCSFRCYEKWCRSRK